MGTLVCSREYFDGIDHIIGLFVVVAYCEHAREHHLYADNMGWSH